MESAGSTAPAAPAQSTGESRVMTATARDGVEEHDAGNSSRHMSHAPLPSPFPPAPNSRRTSGQWAGIDTPAQPPIDHGVESSIRNTATFGVDDMPEPGAAPAHVNGNMNGNVHDAQVPLHLHTDAAEFAGFAYAADALSSSLEEPETTLSAAADEPTPEVHNAFAMLQFPDSYCYVHTPYLMLGRDLKFEAYVKAQRKQERRAAKREAKRKKAQRHAAEFLANYEQEPSMPSVYDDQLASDEEPADDGNLVGHPMPSLLSNYSQQGGVVSFVGEDDQDMITAQYQYRKKKLNSSSNHSIAPQSLHDLAEGDALHTEGYTGREYPDADPSEWAQLSVHPQNPDAIGSISKEHLLLKYNSELGRWVADVHGQNGIWIEEKHYQKGARDVILNHGAEIFIGEIGFFFCLPSNVVAQLQQQEMGQYDDDDEVMESVEVDSNVETSPAARRISDTVESVPSDEEDDVALAERSQKKKAKKSKELKKPLGKIKLSLGKKARPPAEEAAGSRTGNGKGKGKDRGKGKDKSCAKSTAKAKAQGDATKEDAKAEEQSQSAAEPQAKTEASQDPVAPTAGPADSSAQPAAKPPRPEPKLDPTSAFANAAPGQLPEKRKGPGRPPKNGLLSKRDDAGVKRKLKEYERMGQQAPDLQILLEMVRTEQRAKDAAAKAQAKGEPLPDPPLPSIEAFGSPHPAVPGPSQPVGIAQTPTQGSGSPNEVPAQRPMPPTLPRRARSPSPIKPEHEFTEEQLKKPTMTYIYIIDEILMNIEGGQADLQTIYDKIQKRWPFFKYKVNSVGWQSSVRHNLLQSDRFVEAGKSGKGKYWTIDHNYPLSDKKRKPTPPPRPQMPYQYGAYGQQPINGQMQYNPNGQAGGPGNYASPYTANGPYPPPQQGLMRQNPNGHYQQQGPHANGPPRPPSQQPPQYNPLVMAIVGFRIQYLSQFTAEQKDTMTKTFDEQTAEVENFLKAGGTASSVADAKFDGDSEPCKTLLTIFEAHKKDWATPTVQTPRPADSSTPVPTQTVAPGTQTAAPAQATNNIASASAGQPQGVPPMPVAQNGQPSLGQNDPQNVAANGSSVAPAPPHPHPQASPQPQSQYPPHPPYMQPTPAGISGTSTSVAPDQNGIGASATTQNTTSAPPPQYTDGLAIPHTVAASSAMLATNNPPIALMATNNMPERSVEQMQESHAAVDSKVEGSSMSQAIAEQERQPPKTARQGTWAPLDEPQPTSAGVKRTREDEAEDMETKRVKSGTEIVGEQESPE
ncbi:hypothetical protein AC579_8612 [Pseudocercospora musae]|uniref:Fork-head domain-containing protein n=2 Tax=Pseudocercospora TaxID=131324 RepID=A0A139I4D0_9PEZI|nr:hypothetical protein AC579_8612 [Pseudocercospora musae]